MVLPSHKEILGSLTSAFEAPSHDAIIKSIEGSKLFKAGQAAGQEVREKVGKPLADASSAIFEKAPDIVDSITSPGSKYLTPALKDLGLPSGLAAVAGFVADVAAPGPSVGKAVNKERKFITSAKEAFPELEARVSGQYVPRSTDALAQRARDRISKNIDDAEKLVKEATDDEAVATAAELVNHYSRLASEATDAGVKNTLLDSAARVANDFAPKLTELGRSVQAASILGQQTPAGQIRYAAKIIQDHNRLNPTRKIPELTGEQAGQLFDKVKKIQEMPDGLEKAMAFKKYQDELSQLVPSPMWKKVTSLWKAGLLTGVKTSGLNTLANLFHGVSEVVKDVPAAAVDKVASLFTGERTVGLTTKGTLGGVKEGFEKGWRYLKTGFDERDLNIKLDRNKINFGSGPIAKGLQAYEEGVFRLIGAEDQPFYYAAKARSLSSQAIAKAKNEGLKGADAQKFVDDLIENPTDDMLKSAVNDAEMSVFQNKTLLGDAARAAQKIPGGEIVVPFGRTPAAVVTQVLNYSPVGVVKEVVSQIAKKKFDQRAFSQAFGRSATGTGVLYVGMELAKKGMVSLGYPKDDREQKQWELEGRVPNSILIDGKWRNPNVLGPAGTVLIVGAYLQKGLEETGSLSSALQTAGFGALKSLTDQTFLKGVNQFTEAINDPERYGAALGSRLLGSVVPTIVSDIAQVGDPLKRRTNPKDEGITAPLKSRIPGLRETLEPVVNVFGRPVERAGNALETLADPTRPSRVKSSELLSELRRLAEAGFSSTPTSFADDKKFDFLTSEQKTELRETAGQVLESKLTNLIKSETYKKADDEEKKKLIQDFSDRSRVDARVAMVLELTTDLQGDALRAKLSELKKAGFLTQEVFRRYAQLR